eukprot:3186063-Amphidinium_carterae.2
MPTGRHFCVPCERIEAKFVDYNCNSGIWRHDADLRQPLTWAPYPPACCPSGPQVGCLQLIPRHAVSV